MIKCFCDICKKEIDEGNVLNDSVFNITLPTKNYKVCLDCFEETKKYLESKENDYKLETVRYQKNFYKKWEEIL